MNQTDSQTNPEIPQERLHEYFELIDKLLTCPNGQEPEILEANSTLLDAGLIQTMLRVSAIFAHEGNSDGAEFLVHVARELSKALGFYPDLSVKE
ncbi:hypothetical protein [Calothrix sp. NIES-3974]|uniref:hypothetical protein n=1 Tax=Calothrix sp. NIES-3974 TaxID=2005462 RepID=UPI000B605C82|nr:hypothetical protein [Calothrix sp. NIES-3974]BAZ03777.1 hypothetical protein NIES3974_04070 [Calothrix sp. NIES-3974]